MYRIACGPDGNKPRERAEWTREFFKELSRFRQPILDGYDIHFYNWNIENPAQKETEYGEEDWYRVIDGCRELEEVILEQYRLVREGLDSFREAEGPFPSPECGFTDKMFCFFTFCSHWILPHLRHVCCFYYATCMSLCQ